MASSTASTVSTRFGELLRRHRQAAGLTQAELAERAGLSRRGINDLERGVRQTPRRDTVALLAEALGLAEEERAAFQAAARRSGLTPPAASTAGPPSDIPGETTSSALAPPPALPTGTITFLFTDIEGSTRLLQQLGAPGYAQVRTDHERLLRAASAAYHGREVDSQGDSFFLVFSSAGEAVAAAAAAQRAVAAYPWLAGTAVRVRMGLHSGTAQVAGDRYIGLEVHRAARIAAAGHGGQVLLSEAARVLAESDLPEATALRDLGAHLLKDLQRPEHLWQLVLTDLPGLPADFPPLTTLEAHPHNLPLQPTSLLGREEAVATLTALLRRDDTRLVTLIGPGGVGKTRLGLQVAEELNGSFADGVWFVQLSRLSNAALVIPTIAQTLGLREMGSQSSEELLRDYVRTRQILLLLDNFEQVITAAAGIANLLATSPRLKVLVTSRTALHLRGEQEYAVAPLALPPAGSAAYRRQALEQAISFPAVALFLQRARAARPDFQVTDTSAPVVAAICARLDGLPLAIELAAARVKLLPPPVLLQRLERQLALLTGGTQDVEKRQQTMRRTIAWSYDLLVPDEQRLFRRLAVFVGGCTLGAAEAVCAAPKRLVPLGLDVLDGLSALVDQSLVHQREESGDARFNMLHVIRDYALEQLEASEESEAVWRAHAIYSVALAEEIEPYLLGGRQLPEGLARLEREHDNLRTVLAWTRKQQEVALGLRLAGAMSRYWFLRGHLSEGREWLNGLIALEATVQAAMGIGHMTSPDAVPGYVRAKALYGAGELATFQGEFSRALPLLEQSLALARAAGELALTVRVLHRLGVAAQSQGDLGRATTWYEESLALARQWGDPALIRFPLNNLAQVAYYQGDLQQADARVAAVVEMDQQAGDLIFQAYDLGIWAAIRRRQGDLPQTFRLLREALAVLREAVARGWPLMTYAPYQLVGLAEALAVAGRSEQAARFLGAGEALRATLGMPWRALERADTEATVAPARATVGEERWAAAYAAGQTLTLEEAIDEALESVG